MQAFKKLHRTRQYVFAGDGQALAAGRKEINDKFKTNMKETDEDAVKKVNVCFLEIEGINLNGINRIRC